MVRFTNFWNPKLVDKEDLEEMGPEYYLVVKQPDKGVEWFYTWFLNLLENWIGAEVRKTKEVFGGGEGSAFWGDLARKRSEQERRAATLMKQINGMIRGLHEIVRTLRKIDEQLDKYKGMDEGKEPDEIALKDYWVSRVEGGSQNPTSVTSLAQKVGFATLPDLFYTTILGGAPEEEVDEIVNKKVEQYDIPEKVKYTLKRKLNEFLRWKQRTQRELKARKQFNVKALASRVHQIKLYTEWIRPYLEAVQRMRESREELKKEERASLLTPYSTIAMNYEIMSWRPKYTIEKTIAGRTGVEVEDRTYEHYLPTLIMEFDQIATPATAERKGRSRGFSYPGKLEITMKGRVRPAVEYKGEVVPDIYKERKEKELGEMIDLLSNTINSSLRALKDDLEKYVGEYLEKEEKREILGVEPEEEEEGKKAKGFAAIFQTDRMQKIRDKVESRMKNVRKRRKELLGLKLGGGKEEEEKEYAKSTVEGMAWGPYKVFKQANPWFETWTEKVGKEYV